MSNTGNPALGLSDAEDINQVKQHKLERRLKRTDLTEKERKEAEEGLGFVRTEFSHIRSKRKRLVQQLLDKL